MSTINKTYLDLNGLTQYDEKIKEYISTSGTSNYNNLTNKPSINGVTLSGNKTTSDLGLQGELTFDNVPTDGSNNPVKSDGIYDSEKDIYAVMGKMGAKNLLPYPYKETTKTVNGVTFTDNGDGTITANGTATNDAIIVLYQRSISLLKAGRYILTGCPEGGGTNIYKIQAAKNDWSFGGADFGAGVVLDITNESTQQIQYIRILVSSGQTVSNLTFKPMLRLASDTDDTYQPYAKTNKQLTDEIANKVDKVAGKGLSTNDYTNTDKANVAKVSEKADKTATATGETLSLIPTSEGRALLHTAYGMSTQSGTPTPSSPVDIESAKADFISTDGEKTQNVTTDLTLRAIEVTSSDAYNLVRDGKYYIADTLDYSEDNGYVVTRRIKESVINGSQLITTSSDGHTMTANDLYTANECISFLSPNNRFKAIDGNSTNLANANSKLSNGECIKRNTKQSIAASDYFKNTSMTSASDWTTWLTSNPITVYDILATPTTENITTEQALALLGLKTYDESTTISSQAEPACTIAVEYAKERLGALALTAYNKTDKLTNTDSFYGTCSTAAGTAAKVVTLVNADNFSLRPGVTVTVKFSANNTAQNPTINVNGTGVKSVWYNTAVVATSSLWAAGTVNRPMRYTYDGTYWVWMGQSIDNNTTYSAMSTKELTTGTATTQRTVRADYLKAGINSLIDTKIAGKADASDVTALAGRVTNVQVSATQPTGQVAGDIWIKLSGSGGNS